MCLSKNKASPLYLDTPSTSTHHFCDASPLFGGLLSGIALHAISSRRWDRLVEFIDSIEDRLRGLEQISEDQEDIVAEIVERVIRERSGEKTSCYRNVLLNGLSSQDFDYDSTLEMVNMVARLTPNHIKVLRVINDPEQAKARLGSQRYSARTPSQMVGLPANDLGFFVLLPFFPDWTGSQLGRIWDELCDVHILQRGAPRIDLPPTHAEIGIDFVTTTFSQYLTEYGYDFMRFILTSDTV